MAKNKNLPASTLGQWGERGLVQWILPRLQRQSSSRFRIFPGDDAVVMRSPSRLVLSVDGLSEGTHFRMKWQSILSRHKISLGRALGWKLLGSSLSDLAAMGDVTDRWAMIYVGAPPHVSSQFLKDFFHGLKETAVRYSCALAGGDTVRSRALNLVSAVGGTLRGARALTRTGSKPGDVLAVAGFVGDATIGLRVLENKLKLSARFAGPLVKSFFQAKPLFEEGRVLSKNPGVSALIDLSDSFHESLDLLLDEKKLGFEIEMEKIPRSPAFHSLKLEKKALFSQGEDYSLLFSIAPERVLSLKKKMSFRVIGRVTRGPRRIYTWGGQQIEPGRLFRHFS